MKNILWVINPNSGSGNHEHIIKRLDDLKEKYIYKTTGKNDMKNLWDVLSENNFDLIVVGGGDGTIKMVASLLSNYHHNNLAIMPLGSANGLATELEIQNNPFQLIHAYRNSELKIIKSDAILINDEHHCLHISDVGLNARVVKGYENQPVRGFFGYGLGFLDELNTQDWLFSARYEDKTYDTLMVFFANAKKYGTGVTINPGGKMGDGKFEVGVLKEINPYLIGQLLFIKERLPDKNWLEIISTTKIKLTFNRKVELQVDGEYLGKTDAISARILPDFLSINIATH